MKENSQVDSIIVTDFEENEINLMEKYQGENLLIIIYRNQCLGCAGRAIPLAYDFKNEFKDLQVIGIHTNFGTEKTTEEEIKSIFTIDELPFPIYIDEKHEVFDQFDSEGTPQWLIINKKGVLFRSLFGSQEGSQNRLMYALEDLMNLKSSF
jgi:peroxiredoxin